MITEGRARAWVGACDGVSSRSISVVPNFDWLSSVENAPSRHAKSVPTTLAHLWVRREGRARPGLKAGRYDAEVRYV